MSTAAARRARRETASRALPVFHPIRAVVIDPLEPRHLLAGNFPLVQSFTRSTPPTPQTSASTVTYLLTFTQPVSGVDPSDFKLLTSGPLAASSSVAVTPIDPSNYSVTITTIHGSGSLSLELVDDDSIRDASSTPLGGTGPGNGSYLAPAYQVAQTFPTVLSITRPNGAATTTSASTADFTVTFSKPVTGVTASNFAAAAGTGVQVSAALSVDPVNPSTYTVHLTGISGQGSLGLNLVNPSGIHDSAGNPLADPSGAITFQPQQTLAVGPQPEDLQLADLNSDGVPDLIVANTSGNTIGVMTGHPTGTFDPQVTYATTQPTSILITDMNGDGHLDVVAVGSNQPPSLLPGRGDGTFGPASTFNAGSQIQSVASADFNADGRPDLVFGRSFVQGQPSTVSLVLNAGGGQFSPPSLLATGDSPAAVTAADLNNDANPDIVSANAFASTASILPGTGAGNFLPQSTVALGAFPNSITTADVNGDGKLDLVAADFNAARLSVLPGNGNGTFQSQLTFATNPYPASLRVADVNGDGKPDLLLTDEINNNLAILTGNGDATFAPLHTFATGTFPSSLATADVDADGRPDLIAANQASATVSIFRAASPATFVGQTYQIIAPANTVSGTAANDSFTLARDPDNSHTDWTLGSTTGQVLINDPTGLTLNGLGGADTLTLDTSHGNPLPATLHLNGIFSVVGLSGANPLAGVTLDIGQSTVYLNNPSSQLPLSLIRQYIANGYDHGPWTGTPTPTTGVITSAAAAQSPLNAPNTFAIAYADSSTGSVQGQPPNTIELRYTAMGDTNLDATVNSLDAITMTRNYALPTPTTWTQGDFNYDAAVNLADATLLQRNFNVTVPPVTFSAPTVATHGISPLSTSTPTSPSLPSTTANQDDDFKNPWEARAKAKVRRAIGLDHHFR